MAQAASAPPGVHRASKATGLYLKVDGASRSWFYRFRLGGGERRSMGLGPLHKVPLTEARKAAKKASLLRDEGIDPIEERKARRAANIARSKELRGEKLTFAAAVDGYLREAVKAWRHRNAVQTWLNPLKRYAWPTLAHLRVADVKLDHIVAVMAAAEDAGAPELARRVRSRVKSVIDFTIAHGGPDAPRFNPADSALVSKVRPLKRKGERIHFRRLELDAAPLAFRALNERAATDTAFAAWVFVITTASRPSEGLCAKWSEIDFGRGLWTVPAARMKGGKSHQVPLSSLALGVLKRQASVRSGDAIFPGNSGSPISYSHFASAPSRAKINPGSPHSWRSIARDAMADHCGIARETCEAVLAHSLGAVESAYRRETGISARSQCRNTPIGCCRQTQACLRFQSALD
jgi:integrase